MCLDRVRKLGARKACNQASTETPNNNNHNGNGVITASGDAKETFDNIINENQLKAVNHGKVVDNVKPEGDNILQNGNSTNNGNTTYGGVVLKSTLRRKTPPKANLQNGPNKPKISRPIPPPKPKKALTSLKKYQDESVDGSEV